MKVLAERLKWLRDQKRLGQKEVAANIGVTLSGYQKMEYDQANPKIETLVKMAQCFNVTTDFLLGISDVISDLGIIADEFYTLRSRKSVKSKELEEINFKMYDIYALKGVPDYNPEKHKEHELMEVILKEKKVTLERDLYDIQEEYRNTIFNYIKTLLEIPESNVFKNPIIKLLSPFNIEIQLNLFEEYSLALSCKEGFIGNYGAYKTEEEALEVRKVLLTMFNSKLY
jgi:transcriptional regulator with XRE-family HTH domain